MAFLCLVVLLQFLAGCWGSTETDCPITNHTDNDWPEHTECTIFVVNPNQDTAWLPSEAPEFNCTCYGETPWQSCPSWTIPTGMDDVDILDQHHELHDESCSSFLTIKSNQKGFTRPRIQIELLCTAKNDSMNTRQCANLTFQKAGNEERCSVDTDCWSLEQECDEGKCACSEETPIFESDEGRCHSGRYLGESCVLHAQCQNEDNNSVCDGGFCRCKKGYQTQDDMTCQVSPKPDCGNFSITNDTTRLAPSDVVRVVCGCFSATAEAFCPQWIVDDENVQVNNQTEKSGNKSCFTVLNLKLRNTIVNREQVEVTCLGPNGKEEKTQLIFEKVGYGGHCNMNSDCLISDMQCTEDKCVCPSDHPNYDTKLNKCAAGPVSSARGHYSEWNSVLSVLGAICIIGRNPRIVNH